VIHLVRGCWLTTVVGDREQSAVLSRSCRTRTYLHGTTNGSDIQVVSIQSLNIVWYRPSGPVAQIHQDSFLRSRLLDLVAHSLSLRFSPVGSIVVEGACKRTSPESLRDGLSFPVGLLDGFCVCVVSGNVRLSKGVIAN